MNTKQQRNPFSLFSLLITHSLAELVVMGGGSSTPSFSSSPLLPLPLHHPSLPASFEDNLVYLETLSTSFEVLSASFEVLSASFEVLFASLEVLLAISLFNNTINSASAPLHWPCIELELFLKILVLIFFFFFFFFF
jgi:hypothetical protein